MMRYIVILFFVTLLVSPAQAILPPDAKAREPQLRAYRKQLNEKYEKRLIERKEEAVCAYQKTEASIYIPPWQRAEAANSVLSAARSSAVATVKTQKRNHRLLMSVVLLILIGTGAGWAWYMTREIDK